MRFGKDLSDTQMFRRKGSMRPGSQLTTNRENVFNLGNMRSSLEHMSFTDDNPQSADVGDGVFDDYRRALFEAL